MRLVFLGTGTSSGVPAIGCDCPVCASPDPRDKRLRTSALLGFTDPAGTPRSVLIDAGPDLRAQALRACMTRLDTVLLTHNHVDHVWGLDEVRRFNVLMGGPIDVWSDAHTLGSIRRVYRHIFEPHTNVQKSFVASLIPREAKAFAPFDLYGLTVTPIRLLHGRLPILGYRLDAPAHVQGANSLLPMAYCTDVSAIPPETWPYLSDLSTLVLDALRYRHHPTHMTLDQAVDVAVRVDARQTFFVHMSHDLGHAATEKELPPGIRLAFDGLCLSEADEPADASGVPPS